MKFAILMYSNERETRSLSPAQLQEIGQKHEVLRKSLTDSGELLNGIALEFPSQTLSAQLSNNDIISSDGPLINAEKQMTAYYVIECDSPERALEIAGQTLDYHVTAIEVRCIHDSVGI
jgi:hypothetical protein